ncbi:MAG: N-acetyl-D-Glu racemase DgcA [Alphaproteobacteria bacterium]|jgi:L-alanine-DL-glutamate epimerase-like enolase superfamily enzyme
MSILLTQTEEVFPIRGVFRISRGSRTESRAVIATLTDGEHVGRGECMPYARYDETVDSVLAEISGLAPAIANGATRLDIQSLLPAGAARNAIDCAFWDLEAKRSSRRAWDLAGIDQPNGVVTAYTLSLDEPDAMGRAANTAKDRPLLKIKLAGEGDLERVAAIRENAPDAILIVDANEGWTPGMVTPFSEKLAALGVSMIEQPLPASADAPLADLPHPVPLCADESAHTSADISRLAGRYDVVNIKLDKTGGLTEALKFRDAILAANMQVMVGCMLGSSLAMAPAMLIAEGAAFVDLDGPLLLDRDRDPGLCYTGSKITTPSPNLWG